MKNNMREWKQSDAITGYALQSCSSALRERGMWAQVEILEREKRINNLNSEAQKVVIEKMSGKIGEWGAK